MFDSVTVDLISSAPLLGGLNLSELPQILTKAYTTIVSARISLQESTSENGYTDEFLEIIREMRRLAFTQEALVSTLAERENRAAAAFVGGTAHYVRLLAEKSRQTKAMPSYLSYQAISPEVSATLLFMIAEANADAAEMAESIVVQTDDAVEKALLMAIKDLAKGRLKPILQRAIPSPDNFLNTDFFSQAVRTLYYLLLQGIRLLAANMLGEVIDKTNFVKQDPKALFEHVKSLCIEPINIGADNEENIQYSLYPGPLHLASLLSSAAQDLLSSALVIIPPPEGIYEDNWLMIMREIAKHRPYLWQNHRQAINDGYLKIGTSSVISFPTGAGKSTLAELKIAVTISRGLKVIFLAPTLALVDQTTKALAKTFPKTEVRQEQSEIDLLDFDSNDLPNISVMTPEHCLAILCFNRDIFNDVGLIIFDECHLMHPRQPNNCRRAIDSMLCVLNLTAIAKQADVLFLSAMMKNTEEIAGWVQSLTNRPCLALILAWKPTRQARGCVVYDSDKISKLELALREGHAKYDTKNAPTELKRTLKAQPFGFFCLHQTWHTQKVKDYALVPLLKNTVVLSTGTNRRENWYLTTNGNQVASAIAEACTRQRIKTLVFIQTIPWTNSSMDNLNKSLGFPECKLTTDERRLYDIAVDEAGGANYLYIKVDANGKLQSSCVCHHGLLLPAERYLHESLYKRRDGINIMVATSTLTQGMNLPSEVVIIAGDSRFDSTTNQMEQLEAFELLNAAGRAGRAGESSYGLVLIVPSKVISYDNKKTISRHWGELQAIFSQSDQCLEINDPLESLLDHIHLASTNLSPMDSYLMRRLPIEEPSTENDSDAPARELLSRSFAAYKAKQKGNHHWIETRIASAIAIRQFNPEISNAISWADVLSAGSGIPITIIRDLGKELKRMEQKLIYEMPMLAWRDWLLNWLERNLNLIPELLRKESLEGLFGNPYKILNNDIERGRYALPILSNMLNCWMAGGSLAEIESTYGTSNNKLNKCKNAREFVLRLIPELAYVFSLPAQVYRSMYKDTLDVINFPSELEALGGCIREGFDQSEKFNYWKESINKQKNRREIHRYFSYFH